MKTQVLFRLGLGEADECRVAETYFSTIAYRSEIERGSLIIPRYSALPYYDELEQDVKRLGGKLIQSYADHRWIANFDYYRELREYTFETWDTSNIYKAPEDIAYVVKGRTNSRKFQWNTSMYAEDRRNALMVGTQLQSDLTIGSQGILYRRYVPLKRWETGINGMPMSNEYRFFFYKENLLGSSFYWAIADQIPDGIPAPAANLARKIASIASNFTTFFVLDVAEKEEGGWVLVEMNCGTMSGLSLIDPIDLYSNLKACLR